MCKWTPLAGGEAEVVTDNSTNANTITGTDLAFLQSDESSSDNNLNNSNKDILNALDETLESAAESTLNDLFNPVDEKGVAQVQNMPDPISYPQQSANQLTELKLSLQVAALKLLLPKLLLRSCCS